MIEDQTIVRDRIAALDAKLDRMAEMLAAMQLSWWYNVGSDRLCDQHGGQPRLAGKQWAEYVKHGPNHE